MKAGRELDALVAEKVMGLKVLGWVAAKWHECNCCPSITAQDEKGGKPHPAYLDDCRDDCPVKTGERPEEHSLNNYALGHDALCLGIVENYSTDIAAAWEVVEKVGLSVDTCGLGLDERPVGYWVGFHSDKGNMVGDMKNASVGFAKTAPLAICLAALKAVGIELPTEASVQDTMTVLK